MTFKKYVHVGWIIEVRPYVKGEDPDSYFLFDDVDPDEDMGVITKSPFNAALRYETKDTFEQKMTPLHDTKLSSFLNDLKDLLIKYNATLDNSDDCIMFLEGVLDDDEYTFQSSIITPEHIEKLLS